MRLFLVFIAFLSACSPREVVEDEFKALQTPRLGSDSDRRQRSLALRAVIIGQLQSKRDQNDKALSSFEKARELLSSPPAPLVKKIVELLVKDGKLDQALIEIDKSLESFPGDKELLLFKAGALESLNRRAEAQEILSALSKAHPDDASVIVLLSSILIDSGDANQAISLLERLDPGLIPRVYLARAYEVSGERKKAIQILDKVTKDYPKNAGARFELARILLGANQVVRAKSELNTVLKYEPNHIPSRRLLSILSLQEKNFDSARDHLEVLESLESDPTDTRYRLALLEIEDKNFDAALRELSLVLAARPEHAEARYALATVFFTKGRKGEAVVELEKVPESSPLFSKAKAVLFSIFQESGDLERAEAEIEKAYNLDPSNKIFLLPYISILRAQSKFEEALKVLGSAQMEDDLKLMFIYGLTLEEAGRRDDAFGIMEGLIVKDPSNYDAKNYVAYVLIDDNRELDRAEKLITEALSAKPADPYFLDTFGWLRFKQRRFGDAVTILRKAHEAAPDDEVILEHLVEALKSNGDSYTDELNKLLGMVSEEEARRLKEL